MNCSIDELVKNISAIDEELKQFPFPQEDYSGGPPETYTLNKLFTFYCFLLANAVTTE